MGIIKKVQIAEAREQPVPLIFFRRLIFLEENIFSSFSSKINLSKISVSVSKKDLIKMFLLKVCKNGNCKNSSLFGVIKKL